MKIFAAKSGTDCSDALRAFFVNDVVSQNDADGHADHLLPVSWSMSFGFVEHAFWSHGACLLESWSNALGLSDDATWLSKEYKLEALDTAPP